MAADLMQDQVADAASDYSNSTDAELTALRDMIASTADRLSKFTPTPEILALRARFEDAPTAKLGQQLLELETRLGRAHQDSVAGRVARMLDQVEELDDELIARKAAARAEVAGKPFREALDHAGRSLKLAEEADEAIEAASVKVQAFIESRKPMLNAAVKAALALDRNPGSDLIWNLRSNLGDDRLTNPHAGGLTSAARRAENWLARNLGARLHEASR